MLSFPLMLLALCTAVTPPVAAHPSAPPAVVIPTATGNTPSVPWIWGITIDDPRSNMAEIRDAIGSFDQQMTTRIVFDEWVPATAYRAAVDNIAAVSFTQGMLLDSYYVSEYSIADYLARADEYFREFGPVIDLWEVGNEVNGEWLGDSRDVARKVIGANRLAHSRGLKTAITLYWNGPYNGGKPSEFNCWEDPDHQMFKWVTDNLPASTRSNFDCVWVSYYEDDCLDLQPDWPAVFDTLGLLFPHSALGIGECGTLFPARKESYIDRYYRDLDAAHPRFAGGFFWWYGKQDFVPKSKPLWQSLQDAMNERVFVR